MPKRIKPKWNQKDQGTINGKAGGEKLAQSLILFLWKIEQIWF